MAIAYSGGPIVFETAVRGDTVSNIITDLDTAFVAADWADRTAISGGFRYTLISPQGLTAKAELVDSGGGDAIIRFTSFDGSRVGVDHFLQVGTGRTFRIHANPCQTFIARNTIATGDRTAAQGGIPFVPQVGTAGCGLEAGPTATSEAWWSCGDTGNVASFRRAHYGESNWAACHNGDLILSTDANFSNRLRIATLALSLNIDFYFGTVQRTRHYGGGSDPTSDRPLYVDPLLCWGSGADTAAVAKCRGQLFDAVMPTLDRPLDYSQTLLDPDHGTYDFSNYMHDDAAITNIKTRFGCLYLLKGASANGYPAGGYIY